jgi:AAA15 family ATPase/GTPase
MKLTVKNFCSIQDQAVELAPITLLYGTNGSGKSSLLYALLTLKNIVLNSNRTGDEFFNYTFINLGNFDGVVCSAAEILDNPIVEYHQRRETRRHGKTSHLQSRIQI